MAPAHLDEGLVGALHDALGADVDPGPGGHLAVHHEALAVELVEVIPGRPVRHEVGIGDQHAGRVRVGAEDAHRLAGLHQQRLVGFEPPQRRHDAVEAVPVAGGAADAAVDHELAGLLGHVGIEVVHEHAQGRLGEPAPGRERRAVRGADDAGVVDAVHERVMADPDESRAGVRRSTRGRPGKPVASSRAPEATSAVAAAMSGARCRSSSRRGTRGAKRGAGAFQERAGGQRARGSRSPARRRAARCPPRRRCSAPWRGDGARRGRPSRRDPPGWRRSGWNRRWPDRPAACSRDTSAAAVTCGIMKPELRPGRGREERRQAARGRGPPAWRRAARRWSRSRRSPARSCRPRRRPARRGNCRRTGSRPCRGRPGDCRTTPLASMVEGGGRLAQDVEAGAHDLGLAAQAIGILHAVVARQVRGADRAAVHEAAQGCRDLDLAGMAAQAWMRGSKGASEPLRGVGGERPGHQRGAQDALRLEQAGEGAARSRPGCR